MMELESIGIKVDIHRELFSERMDAGAKELLELDCSSPKDVGCRDWDVGPCMQYNSEKGIKD